MLKLGSKLMRNVNNVFLANSWCLHAEEIAYLCTQLTQRNRVVYQNAQARLTVLCAQSTNKAAMFVTSSAMYK